jgi:glycosyltransferase involved in cell wall biosynthesis
MGNMENAIRLLVITHNYPRYSGDFAGVFLSLLNRRLTEHGIEPVVLAPHDTGAALYEKVDGVKIYRFRYATDEKDEHLAYRGTMHKLVLGSVGGVFKFKRFLDCNRKAATDIIRTEKIRAVAGHWLVPAGLVMKSIARNHRLPMVLSSHGTDIRLMMRYMHVTYSYFRKFCRGLNRWTVVSNFLKDEIIRLDPHLENVLTVLPLPHNEDVFYRDETVVRDENLVTSVTRFTEQKRVAYLIKAFALVAQGNQRARLEIYGTGPGQPIIEELIRKFGLERQVTIHAPVPQDRLREVYNRSAVVVLNSYREGFGLTLSEAMLCGAAVIGTRSGGIIDIIEHERRGLLVPLDDSAALAAAMECLLRDQPLRQRLAEEGRRFALDNYASGPLAAKYAAVIRAAVGS